MLKISTIEYMEESGRGLVKGCNITCKGKLKEDFSIIKSGFIKYIWVVARNKYHSVSILLVMKREGFFIFWKKWVKSNLVIAEIIHKT